MRKLFLALAVLAGLAGSMAAYHVMIAPALADGCSDGGCN